MVNELPGQRTTDAGTSPRAILMNTEGVITLSGPCVMDSVNAYDGGNTNRVDEIRAGMLMAQVTATKKWVPLQRTRANGAGSTATALTVFDARAFQVGQKLTVGSNTNCVISAINYATNVITLSATKTWSDLDVVYATTFKDGTTTAAGAETCRGVLSQGVRLLSGIPFETTWIDKQVVVLCGGYFNSSYILGDLAAAKADTSSKLTQCIWSDVQQGT